MGEGEREREGGWGGGGGGETNICMYFKGMGLGGASARPHSLAICYTLHITCKVARQGRAYRTAHHLTNNYFRLVSANHQVLFTSTLHVLVNFTNEAVYFDERTVNTVSDLCTLLLTTTVKTFFTYSKPMTILF